MGIIFIIAIVILISVYALGLMVLANNRSSSINQVFAALIFFIAFWLTSSLFIDLSFTLVGVIFWAQTAIVWIAAIPAIFLYFTYIFPQRVALSNIKKVIITLPSLIFLIFSPTSWNVRSVKILEDGTREIIHGPLHLLLTAYFIIFLIWALVKLIQSYRKNKSDVVKLQIKYILIGTISSSVLALFGTILFPFLGIERVANFSALTVLFFIVSSTYAILRHHLLQIRVLTAEIFTGLLLLILLVNVFTFENKQQLVLNLALFLSAIVFGIFLVKSVLQEIEARQETEKLAKKLQKANIKLKELDKAKSEFISIASHQLRTPLSAIKGYVSMILDGSYGKLDKTKKEVLNRVYTSNERLIGLVNDLLNLSRIERGKLQFEFRQVDDLKDILESVINEAKVNAHKKNLKIEAKLQKVPVIYADPHKMRQVFVNIIDNAIKYTEKGGLEITNEIQDNKITFKFKDTGVGMIKEEIDAIYEKFRRGKGGEKYHAGGMGIGLYICHKIVEAHEGKVYAKSEGENMGTTFYVELPYKKYYTKGQKKDKKTN
jgi:signal transduction histidine kinase